MIGSSRRRIAVETVRPPSKAHNPSTNPTLVMFEPMALPTASPELPASAARQETSNSGADEPTATMVSPTTSGVMPSELASAAAWSTKRLRF